MWDKDCQIDPIRLDQVSAESPMLHSKYIQIHDRVRLKQKQLELDLEELKATKMRWMTGKMSKTEMDQLGYSYDPFKGASKPLKTEMNSYVESDPEVKKLKLKLEYYKTMKDTLADILQNIRWRHANIKNMIEWRKFTSGD